MNAESWRRTTIVIVLLCLLRRWRPRHLNIQIAVGQLTSTICRHRWDTWILFICYVHLERNYMNFSHQIQRKAFIQNTHNKLFILPFTCLLYQPKIIMHCILVYATCDQHITSFPTFQSIVWLWDLNGNSFQWILMDFFFTI